MPEPRYADQMSTHPDPFADVRHALVKLGATEVARLRRRARAGDSDAIRRLRELGLPAG